MYYIASYYSEWADCVSKSYNIIIVTNVDIYMNRQTDACI